LAIRSVYELAVALAVFFSPATIFELVLFLFGMFWVVSGIAAVISNVGTEHHVERVVDVWPRFFEWLASRPYTEDDRQQLYEKLFYEGDVATRRLSRFFLLMLFAATIAALGVVSDSTAVVIGAMLVAPLMTPLMGTALSLAMGWSKRTLMSAGVALGGILLTVGLSAFIGAIIPFDLQFATNAQVVSRVSPTLVDLFIAMAAGAAGGFALSRPDVSDALPGVAVAIALVPPLAVLGLLLEARAFEDAFGALTLFTTNAVAILLVGALVFLLTGVAPVARLRESRQQVRNSLTLVGTLAIVILTLLGITGEEIQTQAYDRDEANRTVQSWIGDQNLTSFAVDVAPDEVEVVLVGPDRPQGVVQLADDLEAALGRDLDVSVRWIFEERFVVGSEG
jgi:uncharacterized hydrophobic protein (TIGR00271 family)